MMKTTLRERQLELKALLALTLMKCGEDLLTHHSEFVTSGLEHENKRSEDSYASGGGFLTIIYNSSQSSGQHCG